MKRQKKLLTLSLCTALCVSAGVAGVAFNAVEASAENEYKTATQTNAFAFDEGASIRVSEPTGVRFTATVNATADGKTLYTVEDGVVSISKGVEIGMIVVPAQALAGVQNTYDVFDYLYQEYGKTAEKVSTVFEASQFVKNEDGEYCVKGAIVNIIPANYNYEYQAIAYYKTNDTYYYSAKSDTRTIAYVADGALNDTKKTWSSENIKKFKKIITDSFAYAHGESYKAEVTVGDTLDVASLLPAVENVGGFEYSVEDNGVATLSGSTITANAPGETKVTVNAYGGELLTISVKATYQQINVETEVDAGLDLATAINGTVASVTLNGEEVTHTNGVVELEKTDAGKDARAYIVTDTEGNKYQVNAKIWSLFIDNAEELMKANTYTWNEQYQANAEGVLNYKIWGYFKLTDNIDMTGKTWGKANAIATEVTTTYQDGGFLGVFDGNNKTIDNFTLSNESGFALISYTGETAEVKNLTIKNVVYAYIHGVSPFVYFACGGMFENITIEVKSGLRGWKIDDASGALFGKVYVYGAPVIVKDVKIIYNVANFNESNYGGGYGYGTALGLLTGTDKTRLVLDGVTIIGFNDYLLAVKDNSTNVGYMGESSMRNPDKSASEEQKSIYDYVTVQGKGLKVYDDNDDYIDSAIELPAQEVELDDTKDYTVTVDFASMVEGEIKSITIDNVAITGTSKTFGKADTSDVAKTCLIEMKDGTLYKVNITVWSLLIDNEDELMKATNYTNDVQVGDTVGKSASYGHFKLTTDLNMTNKDWTTNNAIGKVTTTAGKAYGFQGVFDGNNKTITGFTLSATKESLFNRTGTNANIKNLKFVSASIADKIGTGVLAYYTSGGSFTNISISVTKMPKGSSNNGGDTAPGILFGTMQQFGGTINLTNIELKNESTESFTPTENDYFGAVLGSTTGGKFSSKVTINGIKITDFGTACVFRVSGSSDGYYVGVDSNTTATSWLSSYNIVLTGAGLTVDGTTYGATNA